MLWEFREKGGQLDSLSMLWEFEEQGEQLDSPCYDNSEKKGTVRQSLNVMRIQRSNKNSWTILHVVQI